MNSYQALRSSPDLFTDPFGRIVVPGPPRWDDFPQVPPLKPKPDGIVNWRDCSNLTAAEKGRIERNFSDACFELRASLYNFRRSASPFVQDHRLPQWFTTGYSRYRAQIIRMLSTAVRYACEAGAEIECECNCGKDDIAFVTKWPDRFLRALGFPTLASGPIHICPPFAGLADWQQKQKFLHEISHYGGTSDTNDRSPDDAYFWEFAPDVFFSTFPDSGPPL